MFDSFDFLEPSLSLDSFSYPAMMEEELSNKVDNCIDSIKGQYGYSMSLFMFNMAMKECGIDYDSLPHYYQQKIDHEFYIY